MIVQHHLLLVAISCYQVLSGATMAVFVTTVVMNVCRSSCNVPVIFCLTLTKLCFLAVFSKTLKLNKTHENPYSRSQVVPCGQIREETETDTS
jgi:hypothetical protein